MLKISWTSEASQGLAQLPATDARRLVEKIELLAAKPKGPHGKWWRAFSDTEGRIRQGDWRALYLIDDAAGAIAIMDVDHRSRIYD